jgi:restriction system protein
MNTIDDTNYYMIRSTADLVEKGIAGVGWVDFRLNDFANAEEAIAQIIVEWGSIRKWANQIRRFYKAKEGDIAIVPLPNTVAIGKFKGQISFDETYYDSDRANQHAIDFFRDENNKVITIPRTELSEAFQRRLRVQGITINNFFEFQDEINKHILSLSIGGNHTWKSDIHDKIRDRSIEFKKQLLNNIQSGKTNLKTGGVGLENLVCELLKIDGYKDAKVLSKRHFSGSADADIEATRSDRFSEVKLLIQVKHHNGFSNDDGIRQLNEISKNHGNEYSDHSHVLVTSAHVSENLIKIAEKENVIIVSGPELVDWIYDNITQLDTNTKFSLGIYDIPSII